MDYFIVFITTAAGLYFHGWLYLRIKRWMDRDLALSLAGSDPDKRTYMLERLGEARKAKIKRRYLQPWLENAALAYRAD
ncbi:hypothetical protein [Aquipseudomonas campi]